MALLKERESPWNCSPRHSDPSSFSPASVLPRHLAPAFFPTGAWRVAEGEEAVAACGTANGPWRRAA